MTRANDKEAWIKAVGSHSVRLTRRGDITTLPKNAKEPPAPTLRQMFLENRKNRKDLMKRLKQGEDVSAALALVRRRAKWVKHRMHEEAAQSRTRNKHDD